ncbi:glycoside hydrolase family 78 protein [Parapedobacter deserti]|uniref:alpha-L-rhamnosidase n=2 Tax=Parapedobacter deserti TaxID=1912957 RepID=A0ABV7JPX2_9SPHI
MQATAQNLAVYDLTCEYKTNPLGMDKVQPRLSWKIRSTQNDVVQTAYEIRVGTQSNRWTASAAVWQSGKVAGDRSILVPYAGDALQSAKRYYWQVRVWDNHGNVSPWSEVNWWEMGLLNTGDWKAQWISHPADTLPVSGPAPMFRKTFSAPGPVKQARLYITSQGLYEAQLNGQQIGEAYFTPGWTSYHSQLQYQVYDVTNLIKRGDNALGVTLGDGWFRGNLMVAGRNLYGKTLALLAQLEVTYSDGRVERVVTDGSWKASLDGPIRVSDIYNGETYDARKVLHDWVSPSFDDRIWDAVSVSPSPRYDHLVISAAPPVTIHERIKPIALITTPKGEKVLDFGQNLVGRVSFSATGAPGDSLVIHHAEVLDKDGNFYTENLRAAKQQITYIFNGAGEEAYAPHFTFQGFRYIKLGGNADLIDTTNIVAEVLHSATKPTGTFETSNPLLNQLQHNIVWGQKGNFLDVPTDCPQRDERLGWTGDAQAFFSTAAFNMDVSGFFVKWLKDLKAEQYNSGAVPHVIPNVWKSEDGGSAGWSDVATIIPWEFYVVYGDTTILADQYESMVRWVGFMEAKSTDDLWNTGFHFGDWLFFRPDDDTDGRSAITDKYLIAQAFFAHSTQLLINAASVLGRTDDVAKYESLLKRIKAAFLREYVTPSGRLVSGTQTAYVLALHFDMLPEDLREQAARRLADNIASYGNHLTTGFLGTPYLCHVLSRFGYDDIAFTLLMRERYPSWLYPVTQGATTIWERWDGQKPNGTFQNAGMNSFNHYAYGAIGDWMYKHIGGIQPIADKPGYREFVLSPKIGGGLTSAKTSLESPYGAIRSEWMLEGDRVKLAVEVPVNTKATIVFNAARGGSIRDARGETVASGLQIGSGRYEFEYLVDSTK